MYFESRAAAGQQLAEELIKRHQGEPCTIIALSNGAVRVGLQIAQRLNCPIAMLVTEEIALPNETTPIGGMTASGVFEYNHEYSKYELDEFIMEYHGIIEQNKLEKLSRMHREMTTGDLIEPELLVDRNIILVSDGLRGGFVLDLAAAVLKPIKHRKLIVATPFADVIAVDRMHIFADELHCINVLENYISTDHYYDFQDAPTKEEASNIISYEIREWYAANHPDAGVGQPRLRFEPMQPKHTHAHKSHHPRQHPSLRPSAA